MDRVLATRLTRMERRLAAMELALDQAHIARPTPRPRPEAPTPPVQLPSPEPASADTLPPPLPPSAAPHATRTRVSQPPTPQPRSTPSPRPEPRTHAPASPPDWERFFGLAVLGRIGVAAVLLAAGYFAQLAYKGLPPLGKVASIYALAALFIGVGAWLRPRVATRYVALLWGGGAASAYLAAITAHLRYDLVGDTLALGMLIAASGLGHVLARTLRHQTLASMALAGAFAAPLIADASLANGGFLLVYLLLLHGWSAWMEERWSWASARIVGLVGTGVVVVRWLQLHGAVDATTYTLLHLYLAGLMAPEIVRLVRGKVLGPERAFVIPWAVAALEFMLVVLAFGRAGPDPAMMTTALLAGLGWTALACALGAAGREGHAGLLVRALARVGGVFVALGVPLALRALPGDFPLAEETVGVWGLACVALGALALRPRLVVGDLTAAVATPLACVLAVVPSDAQHVFVLFPIAAATAAAVLVLSRHAVARAIAAWSGLITIGVGLHAGARFEAQDTVWLPIALTLAAAWALGVLAFARRRELPSLVLHGMLQLWLLGILWVAQGFTTLVDVRVPLLDPMTLSGVLLACAAGYTAWRHRHEEGPRMPFAASLWLLALALPVLAGHREMVSAVASLERLARDAWHTIYFAVAGVSLGWLGRRRHPLLGAGALAVAGIAVLKMLTDAERAITASPWTAAQVAAALAAPWALAFLVRRLRGQQVLVAFYLFAAAALGYALHSAWGHLPARVPFLDFRFLLGLLVLAGAWAFPYERLDGASRRPTATGALLGGLLLGFGIGYAELWDLVKDLGAAWPAVLVSVYMALFAAVTLAIGFARRDKRLRYPALGLFGLVVLKVGLHDLATAELTLRIFVTGILGLVLLGAAFAYARRTGPDGDDRREGPLAPGGPRASQ